MPSPSPPNLRGKRALEVCHRICIAEGFVTTQNATEARIGPWVCLPHLALFDPQQPPCLSTKPPPCLECKVSVVMLPD